MSHLAVAGGPPVLDHYPEPMFHWPIVNDAMRTAYLQVLEDGNMSGLDITRKFEAAFAEWQGLKYALAHNTGTGALNAAMYAIGLGPGDEMICTSLTYWASCTGAPHLGAKVVFCDIDADTLQMDPASVEAHITPRTKALMVVHYLSCPADMDAIMAIADKYHLAVIEDVSHAQGGHYKGKMLGTFGNVAAMSLMSGKSFAIGEGGMLVTNDYEIYRKAIRWGHYARIAEVYAKEDYADTFTVPFGGVKNRMSQTSSAVGLEQLKKYEAEKAEIDRAMKYFWQGLVDINGIRCIYPQEEGSDKAGWYCSRFHYDQDAFDGVSCWSFCKALNAEVGGTGFASGCNYPLHQSSVFQCPADLPVAASINNTLLGEPWFKHYQPELINAYIEAIHKVAEYHTELLANDEKRVLTGGIGLTPSR